MSQHDKRIWANRIAESFLDRVISIDGGLKPSRKTLGGVDDSVFKFIRARKHYTGKRSITFPEVVEAKLRSVNPEHVRDSLKRLQEWGRIYPVEYCDSQGEIYTGYREASTLIVDDRTIEDVQALVRSAGVEGLTSVDIANSVSDRRWEAAVERLASANLIVVRLIGDDTSGFSYHPVIRVE